MDDDTKFLVKALFKALDQSITPGKGKQTDKLLLRTQKWFADNDIEAPQLSGFNQKRLEQYKEKT